MISRMVTPSLAAIIFNSAWASWSISTVIFFTKSRVLGCWKAFFTGGFLRRGLCRRGGGGLFTRAGLVGNTCSGGHCICSIISVVTVSYPCISIGV